ncbi:MAG: lipopolysaccharide biosynthesis protein [Pseudomonadota bacterium]
MAKGAMWTILFKFATRGIGLISTVILARLLVPADFGLVAMAMAIIAALEILSAFNLDVVLIQHQTAERKHYDTAWTFNFIAGLIQGLMLVAAAPLVAHFYNDDRLTLILYILALGRVLGGLENIGMVAFRKDLQFHRDFNFQVTKKMAGFIVTIALAFWFKNYWALIAGMLAGQLAGVILSYTMQPYRPKFCVAAMSELFHFSKWLLINNFLYFLIHQSSDFILGKLGGPSALGLFKISHEIANLPSTDLVAPINRAIFPGYVKMAGDMHVLRQGFLNVLSAIALFVLPIGIGIALTAEPLVHLMLGRNWVDAVPLIQILAVSGIIIALQTNQGSVYLALGRPKTLTLLAGLHAAVLLPLLIWGALKGGALGAAVATAVTSALMMPINFIILLRSIKLHTAQCAAVLWRPLAATAVMIFTVKITLELIPGSSLLIYISQLLLATIIGGTTYIAVIIFLWRLTGRQSGIEATILTRASAKLKSFF